MVAEFCGYGKISHTSTNVYITYVPLMTYIIYKFYFTNKFSLYILTHIGILNAIANRNIMIRLRSDSNVLESESRHNI